ncbi:putative protein N(5)-glutamine methyltransferase [Plantactinospora sp. BB1]|nr:putative protein N(5)-glutamine methyltransferase [Plantactinospora sp. BB1]
MPSTVRPAATAGHAPRPGRHESGRSVATAHGPGRTAARWGTLRASFVATRGGGTDFRVDRPGAPVLRTGALPGAPRAALAGRAPAGVPKGYPLSTPISGPVSTPDGADVVRRLRAAGCVFAEDEAELLTTAARSPTELLAMVELRVSGLPLEHIVGWVDFCGLRVAVDPGVFVPRRRTELLVRRAAALARPGATVLDLACGSGAIGLAVAALVGDVTLYAVDVEPAAVRCARRNLAALDAQVYAGDLYQPLPSRLRGRIDVLVANVPYVPSAAVELLPPEARLHEPLVALDGGRDGLDVLRRVAAGARDWLLPGGHLLVETGLEQAEVAADVFDRAGLDPAVVTDDDLPATVVIGRR